MGLFDKRASKNSYKERLLDVKFESSVTYSSLEDLILSFVSLNSRDSKAITMKFKDGKTVKLWVINNKVAAAHEPDTIDLKEFLYWFESSAEMKNKLINEVKELSPLKLNEIKNLDPMIYPSMLKKVSELKLDVLSRLATQFNDVEELETVIVFKLPAALLELEATGLPLTEIDSGVKAYQARVNDELKALGVSGVPANSITLCTNEASQSESPSKTPEQTFMTEAANANSSLQEALALGRGFSQLSLLKALKELSLTRSEVALTWEQAEDDELPELHEQPLMPYERVFTPTAIHDSAKALVAEVFEASAWLDAMTLLADDNQTLEDRVSEIEDKLIKELASEDFVTFAELPDDVQASVRLLLNEREAHNEKRKAILSKLIDNILVKDSTPGGLTELLTAKLKGIDEALVYFELKLPTVAVNDFQLDEAELDFSFKDAVIDANSNGDPFVRPLEAGDLDSGAGDADAIFKEAFELGLLTGEAVAFDEDEHIFAFNEFYESLTWIERASLGVRPVRDPSKVAPPIFLEVAKKLGVDPNSVSK